VKFGIVPSESDPVSWDTAVAAALVLENESFEGSAEDQCLGSLTYEVRPQQERLRDGEAERLGGLEVDD
jgi:hypothetical protein